MLARQFACAEAPVPVACGARGKIHARLCAETYHVLQRDKRDVRDRGEDGAYEVPVNLVAVRAQILQAVLALLRNLRGGARRAAALFGVEPTKGRVVVVRARIGYVLVLVVVWE